MTWEAGGLIIFPAEVWNSADDGYLHLLLIEASASSCYQVPTLKTHLPPILLSLHGSFIVYCGNLLTMVCIRKNIYALHV